VTSHALDPSVTNCHTFSDPLLSLERDVLYGRPLVRQSMPKMDGHADLTLSVASDLHTKNQIN